MAPGFPRSCAVCRTEDAKVLRRFNLTHHAIQASGSKTTRGAGSIDLCQSCWYTSKLFARLTTPLIRSAARAVA